MGRCGICRTQTQWFCFVHQEFVCDSCLVSVESRIHARCVVNTYRKWVLDNSCEWPPTCSVCAVQLEADGDNIRRLCMHLEHASCLEASAAPDHPCGACNEPLEKSLDSSPIGRAVRNRIRSMPSLQALVTEEDLETDADTQLASNAMSNSAGRSEANPGVEEGNQAEGPSSQYQRQNAALQIIETDLAQSTSQVSPEVAEQPVDVRTTSDGASQAPADAIINISLPKLQSGSVESTTRQGPGVKRDKVTARHATSASVRKALKAGTRRWFDLRKSFLGSQKQVIVVIMFIMCIVLAAILMSGDDEDAAIAAKPIVEDVSLPHVRVNPALFVSSREQDKFHRNDVPSMDDD